MSYGNKTLPPPLPPDTSEIEQRNEKVPHALSFSGRELRQCVRLLYLHCGLPCIVISIKQGKNAMICNYHV